jgi:hypothetical protein
MKIPFSKASKDGNYSLNIENDLFSVNASFHTKAKNISSLFCNLKIDGNVVVQCNMCGIDMNESVNEELDFILHNGVFNGFDDSLDVIEVQNNLIDFDEILIGELELIKDNYFKCENCQKANIDNLDF